MKIFLLLLASLCAFQLTLGKSITTRRPQCICSGKVTAIMQDGSGAYCVYYGEGKTRQWHCENEDEWNAYLTAMAMSSREPRCHCTGDVTAIMQDLTGTYCAHYGENENRQWDCENKEDWDVYNEHLYKENGY